MSMSNDKAKLYRLAIKLMELLSSKYGVSVKVFEPYVRQAIMNMSDNEVSMIIRAMKEVINE